MLCTLPSTLEKKIGTLSVHVGSLSKVSKDTPNYNCMYIPIGIVTILNRCDPSFAGYAETMAICNALFDVS